MGLLAKLTRVIRRKRKNANEQATDSLPSQKQIRPVSSSLDENLTFVSQLLGTNPDVVAGKFEIMGGEGLAGIVYISGLANKDAINKNILEPLIARSRKFKNSQFFWKNRQEFIRSRILTTVDIKETNRIEQVITAVLKGNTCLFVDGTDSAMIIGNVRFEKRSITAPETDTSVRGSREGFIEDIATNVSMVRRRLPTPDLRFETFFLGRFSRTEVRLAWIEGIVNPEIIEEARVRIRRIDIDYVYDSSLIAELIEDKPTSLWPQIQLSERPDVVAANMVEGRFAVFCNGTPFVIIAPLLFWQNLQTPDDYTERPLAGTLFRLLRHGAFYVSLMASPVFIAIVSYHPSMIPQTLAMRIAAGREGVPFPSVFEALLLTLTIDTLREAGTRLPRAIGTAVAVLGAVIIGQAAVAAGFVSPAIIIIVSIAAIANFTIPSLDLANATRIANYFLIILGGVLGLLGVTAGMVLLLYSAVSLRSFGIPLFYPVAPGELYGL
ncbi:MAG: spore germination protein [Bacillota bacterium]